MRQVRMNRTGAEAQKRCHLVHIARFAGLQNDGDLRALFGPDQMLLHGGYRQERRNRHMVLIHAAVGEDDDVLALGCCTVNRNVQLLKCTLQRGILVIQERNRLRVEARLVQ